NRQSRTQDFRENTRVFPLIPPWLRSRPADRRPSSPFAPPLFGKVRQGKRSRARETPEHGRSEPQEPERNRVVVRHSGHSQQNQVSGFANSHPVQGYRQSGGDVRDWHAQQDHRERLR